MESACDGEAFVQSLVRRNQPPTPPPPPGLRFLGQQTKKVSIRSRHLGVEIGSIYIARTHLIRVGAGCALSLAEVDVALYDKVHHVGEFERL